MKMVGERVVNLIDRKPVTQKIEDRIDDAVSGARNRPSRALERRFPKLENRNFGGGTMAGLLEAGIAIVLEDTVGVPFGASSEIVDTEPASNGTIYTVNVNAPTKNMAEARAFLESSTGFASVLTDIVDVEEAEVLNVRPLRDTYQVKVRIRD